VDVGTPITVDASLSTGNISEVVEVSSGGEVLQTQTATVGTNIQGRQITETPIASRDALDLVGMMPGTASVGAPRRSSINGLPKGSLSITIDGVDVQDNLLRSSDGYFTYVRPRVDAIEEVTVSTANPGAESGGDGAVQIKFVTKRGTNNYNGGVFWQHRNTLFNAAYWYNNRDLKPSANGFIPDYRNKVRLNQYGGRYGGPLPFPHFGEGGPKIHSGKDKAFFFFNYEEFRQPESQSRTRVVLNPQAQLGNFSYIAGGVTTTRNLLTLAAANGQVSSIDPTIASMLARIQSATGTSGNFTPITNDVNRQNYNFTPSGGQVRKFLALRFDFNLTKNHSLEFVTNRQLFVQSKDFLNGQDERFPGFPSYTQGSARNSYSTAVRSTLKPTLINEARFAVASGVSSFSPTITASDFGYSNNLLLDIGTPTGITSPYSRNSFSSRNTPTYDFTDSVTWIKGSHSINFGGQYKEIRPTSTALNRIVPTISFGIDATDPTNSSPLWSATNFPGANAAQIAEAKALYATLIGRVTGYAGTAYLGSDGTYKLNGEQTQTSKQRTYGLFAQDSWKISPSFTLNYGLRWQPQGGYVVTSANYARLSSFADVYGLSGEGNLFKPGVLTGRVPTVVGVPIGESAYKEDKMNFAPTVGAVWSPNFGDKSFLRAIFGESGKSVFRGGYSISYVREGTALIGSLLGANPGGNLSAARNLTVGGLTVGSNLRDPGNNNLTANSFLATPAYPLSLTPANSANAFDPNLKTGSVTSFSFGYQRELDRNTVVEFRYVGNRGNNLFRQHNINELNTVENGFASEYALAQANLYANAAAGRCIIAGQTPMTNPGCQFNFAYFGAGTGTSPLPKILAYIHTPTMALPYEPANPLRYSSPLFVNTTLAAQLSRNNPSVIGFAGNVENNAIRRTNAITNGLPSNFFYANSTTLSGGAFILDNSARSWYDSGIIEVRRRLSSGLRVQASYVWSKAQSDSFQSNSDNFANFVHREGGRELAKNVAVFDISHQFKFDATYDLPFGKGRKFFGNANGLADAVLGGWTFLPTVRWQSGSPFSFGNVQLVGLTKKELQKAIKLRKGPNVVTFLPDDIILNTQKAFNIDVTAANGYGTTFGTGGPTGKFLAPAGFGNCQSSFSGQCGYNNLILYGPGFFKFDATIAKKIKFGEKRNIEFRATFLDALNKPNFRVGGFGADLVNAAVGGSTFGQLTNGSAYQDVSTTNDPGGRLIDFMFRFNF
jgi:TonB dependent receptor